MAPFNMTLPRSNGSKTIVEMRADVPRRHVDLVCDFVAENITAGLVLEEDDDSPYTGVIFYVQPEEEDRSRTRLDGFLETLPESLSSPIEISVRYIEEAAWEELYRASVKSLLVAGDVVIRPPWEAPPENARYSLVLEPTLAFGTGRHETTRSCLQIVRDRFQPDMRFLDVGCGSGVLGILADQLQASYLKAIDNDLDAVSCCQENFRLNHVAAPHLIAHGSIELCRDDPPYQFVCANIIKATILEMLPRLAQLTDRPGILVLSGLLEPDLEDVYAALAEQHLSSHTTLADNEWRTVAVFKR